MEKINVLVVPSDNIGGVGFYRSTQPHMELEKMFPDEFSVTIDMNPDWSNLEALKKYKIIHVHKGLFKHIDLFRRAILFCRSVGIVTIMDIDDNWELSPHHPQYLSQKTYGLGKIVTDNLKLFDYVTTTTKLFAKEIKKYNKNVFVIPNAIDPNDERFKTNRPKSDRLRVGMIMGSTHEYDMKIMDDFVKKFSPETLDKIQLVLCGYDLRGKMKLIDQKTGRSEERDIKPTETVWYRYEKMLTNDYKIISEDYKNFLEMFVPNLQYPNVENERYKRCWTKDMNHYYEHYNECDVLLAPLEHNNFNYVKSQLKAIECCFSRTALIASDYGPYQLDLVNAIEKGGKINPNGNAILISENKNHKDWHKSIEKLLKNPELLEQLQNNIHDQLCEKYNLTKVTNDRADIYRNMLKSQKKQ